MPDPKPAASAPSRTSSVEPERTLARELRLHRQARRHSERLVAEWLRRLSTRRS